MIGVSPIQPLVKYTMTTLAELLKQRDEINTQIEALRKQQLDEAKAQIHEIVQAYGLTPEDIFSGKGRSGRKLPPAEPKYRDPATGATWVGRGKPPAWIAGKDRDLFRITEKGI